MFKNTVLIIIALCWGTLTNSQAISTGTAEEINIYEKIYDAQLIGMGGEKMTLIDLHNKKPLLIALIFTRCSGVCNPFLFQLKDNLKLAANNTSVNVLVMSFDPRDGSEDMNLLASRLGLKNNEQWTFALTDSIDRFNRSIGFSPLWDSLINQYDHDALLVGINTEGYITKKLIGVRSAHDLELLIASVNNVFLPSYRLPTNSSMFSCFNYDPRTGKNTPGLGLFFIALPAVLTLLTIVVVRLSVYTTK